MTKKYAESIDDLEKGMELDPKSKKKVMDALKRLGWKSKK